MKKCKAIVWVNQLKRCISNDAIHSEEAWPRWRGNCLVTGSPISETIDCSCYYINSPVVENRHDCQKSDSVCKVGSLQARTEALVRYVRLYLSNFKLPVPQTTLVELVHVHV